MSEPSYDYLRDPTAIYAASFATIESEADLSPFTGLERDVAIRLVHACGMVDVLDDVAMSKGACEHGRAALRSGAPLLCDVQMVARGIIASRLPSGNEIVCNLGDERVPELAAARGTTRSAAQVELWRGRLEGAVVVIGNAPTALFALLEMVADGAPAPALVIGIPVGFVGAVESKEALARSGLPFITVHGRRGGSAMAAAIVNALGEVATPTSVSDARVTDRVAVIGVDAMGAPSRSGRAALAGADLVFGSQRLLSAMRPGAESRTWPTPFSDAAAVVNTERRAGRRVAAVATGDPLHFGVGGTLARALDADALDVHPMPSAFSLAAARMNWPVEDVGCLSLHGRNEAGRGVAALSQWVAPNRRLIALSRDGSTPAQVAVWIAKRGWGPSRLTVLERMGAADERRLDFTAASEIGSCEALNTLAIECIAGDGAEWSPLVGGLPDARFVHDGRITKSDLRAVAVAALRPRPHAILWDVGAGSGAVGLEWLRLSPNGRLHAVEPRADRRALIAENASSFGLADVEVVAGEAPDALADLPRPDAVFVGGGVAREGVIERCLTALEGRGTLVANAVTLEGEARLISLHARHGGELKRIGVHHADALGDFRGWRPAMPVTNWSFHMGGA